MAPTSAKKRGKATRNDTDFCGIDPAMMMALMNRIPRNPTTGKVELMDIMKYMEEHPDEMKDVMSEVEKNDIGKPKIDFTKYDFNKLASSIVHESFWVVQLEAMGYVDRAGNEIHPDKAHSSTGIKPTFMLYCYDEQGTYRTTQEIVGLPESKVVLQTIKRAIAEPTWPLTPCLPWFLLLSIKLTPHASTLKPFLDSLPPPFHWRFETPQEAEGVNDGVDALNQQGVKDCMALAEKEKLAGNKAYGRNDRAGALKAYGKALGYVVDALAQKPKAEDEKKAIKLRAICYANRSAAHSMSGAGVNYQKALEDGLASEEVDPSYAKAYIRQANASQLLGNGDEAVEAIVRALRRRDLQNDVGLVDRLIELMTGGKGFPDDRTAFKLLIDKSSTRLAGVQGEWKSRCEAHCSKWN